MAKHGVQYVSGVPPQTPVLKPSRKILYDRESVWGSKGSFPLKKYFFCDNKKMQDGRAKDQSFTNMFQCATLGYPFEMDLMFVSIMPVCADPDYANHYERFIWSSSVWEWIFGGNTQVALQTLPTMLIRGPVRQFVHDEVTGKPYYVSVKNGQVGAEDISNSPSNSGAPPPIPPFSVSSQYLDRLITRYWKMTNYTGHARRINSTESFRGNIESKPDDPNGKEIDVYMGMGGIYYGMGI